MKLISLFIVIAFCSCKEKKKVKELFHPLPYANTVSNDTLSIRQIVSQSDKTYVLYTTIESQGYRDYLETSNMFILPPGYNPPKPLYQKWISGSFRFIADNKKRQYEIADSMLPYISEEYYKKQEETKKLMEQEKLIEDSVKQLNKITVIYNGPINAQYDSILNHKP